MKEMLVNVSAGQERRLAIVSDTILEELYIERESENSHVGNIYKGKVTNIEPSIQAAFIDFGGVRNGFLHISDLQAQHFPKDKRIEEPVGRKASRKDRPAIQDCLRRGQELIVQVIKSGIGTKGPTLTTYLSVPGRFLVMMPGMTRFGVSRKIEDEDTRGELRGLIEQLDTPEGLGFIVRTAGLGRSKRDLQQDLKYLHRLWRSVQSRMRKHRAPAELFQESDMVIRTIRDVYSSEIDRIICDDASTAEKITEFLRVAMPRTPNKVMMYTGNTPLFDRYGLEDEIERIYSRRIEMPGGASLVIDQAEALVAIDVNSGRNRSNDDAEETAYRINMQAAREVARQLRLRDMGGVIVIDFIDMRYERHQRDIERILREEVKSDRAKTKILKISRFGLVEMTRQRMRPSLKRSMFTECESCHGQGLIKSDESLSLSVIRSLQLACTDSRIVNIKLSVPHRVADYLNNTLRGQIVELENHSGKKITVISEETLAGDEIKIECFDDRNGLINWLPNPKNRNPMPSAPADAPVNLIRKPPTDNELLDIAEYEEPARDKEKNQDTDQPDTDSDAEKDEEAAQDEVEKPRKRRRRRRSRRKSGAANGETDAAENNDENGQTTPADSESETEQVAAEPEPSTENTEGQQAESSEDQEEKPRKKRRRRGGRRRRSQSTQQQTNEQQTQPETEPRHEDNQSHDTRDTRESNDTRNNTQESQENPDTRESDQSQDTHESRDSRKSQEARSGRSSRRSRSRRKSRYTGNSHDSRDSRESHDNTREAQESKEAHDTHQTRNASKTYPEHNMPDTDKRPQQQAQSKPASDADKRPIEATQVEGDSVQPAAKTTPKRRRRRTAAKKAVNVENQQAPANQEVNTTTATPATPAEKETAAATASVKAKTAKRKKATKKTAKKTVKKTTVKKKAAAKSTDTTEAKDGDKPKPAAKKAKTAKKKRTVRKKTTTAKTKTGESE